ncbi:MAG: response regulator transcription factor [Bacteroidota bacterium]
MDKWTIYIADDQTLFRKGMSRLVRSFKNVEKVEEAENGKQVLDLVKKSQPDVILMDLEMPIMDGIEATEKILHKFPKVKIVVLSMHDSYQHIYYLMELGAHAFLLKNAEPEEVEEAIRSVIEHDFYQNKIVIDALRKGAMNRKAAESRPSFGASAPLSDREKEILLLICQEMTMKVISERLSLSERTVQNHRANMMDKLGVKNTVGLVKYAYENGIIQ